MKVLAIYMNASYYQVLVSNVKEAFNTACGVLGLTKQVSAIQYVLLH